MSNFEHGIIIGASQAGLSIPETDDLLNFPIKLILGFTENGLRKRTYPASSSFLGEKTLLMLEIILEWVDYLELIGGQQ